MLSNPNTTMVNVFLIHLYFADRLFFYYIRFELSSRDFSTLPFFFLGRNREKRMEIRAHNRIARLNKTTAVDAGRPYFDHLYVES